MSTVSGTMWPLMLTALELERVNDLALLDDRCRLRAFLGALHGRRMALIWPSAWVFTAVDPDRSPRLQKVGAAVMRDGHLCCEDELVPVGVVHDASRRPGDAEHSVVVLGAGSNVYLYDDGGPLPVVYLLTRFGFLDFCRRGLRERVNLLEDVGPAPVCYDEEPFRSLLQSRGSLDALLVARDRWRGREVRMSHPDDVWTCLRIVDVRRLECEPEELEAWRRGSGHLRLEPLFIVSTRSRDAVVESLVLVSDAETLFYVTPESERLRFLAAGLYNFLVLGMMRFRSGNCFPRGAFDRDADGRRLWGSGGRPICCPRGLLCRRKGRSTARRRLFLWLRVVWRRLTRCPQNQ